MHQTLANTVEVAISSPKSWQFLRQRILNVLVLAAATLEQQLDLDFVFAVLMEVNDRRAGAEVVTAILSGQRIDRVGAELSGLGRAGDGVFDLLFERDLVEADRRGDEECRHAGVLTDRPLTVARHVDVQRDRLQGQRRSAGRVFLLRRLGDRSSHVGRKVRGGLDDQIVKALLERHA